MTEPNENFEAQLHAFLDEAAEIEAYKEQDDLHKLHVLTWFDAYYAEHTETAPLDFGTYGLADNLAYIVALKLSLSTHLEETGYPEGLSRDGMKKQAQADIRHLGGDRIWFELVTDLMPGEGFSDYDDIEFVNYLAALEASDQEAEAKEVAYRLGVIDALYSYLGYQDTHILMPGEELPLDFIAMRLLHTQDERKTVEGKAEFIRETEDDIRMIYWRAELELPAWLHTFLVDLSGFTTQ